MSNWGKVISTFLWNQAWFDIIDMPTYTTTIKFQTQHKAPTRVRELKPKTVEDKESEDQNVRRRMEICRKALKKRITNVGNHPVHYLKFAADPDSFEATVRNLFTLSHLINRQEVST